MSMLMGEVRVEGEGFRVFGVVDVVGLIMGLMGLMGLISLIGLIGGGGASGCRGGRVSVDLPVAPTARYWVAVFAAGCAGCRGERKLARCSLSKRDYFCPRVTFLRTIRQASTLRLALKLYLSVIVDGTMGSSSLNTPVAIAVFIIFSIVMS